MLKRKRSAALFGVYQGGRALRVGQQCRVWTGTAKGTNRAAFGLGACRKAEGLEEASRGLYSEKASSSCHCSSQRGEQRQIMSSRPKKTKCFLNITLRLQKWSESLSAASNSLQPMEYTVLGILQAKTLEWVAYPFSSGSSWPRSQTGVSWIAGRFLTNWAKRDIKIHLSQIKLTHPNHHILPFCVKNVLSLSYTSNNILSIHLVSGMLKSGRHPESLQFSQFRSIHPINSTC